MTDCILWHPRRWWRGLVAVVAGLVLVAGERYP